MNLQSNPSATALFLLIHRLQSTGRSLGRETILPFAEFKLPRVVKEYDLLIAQMLAERRIEGDAEHFSLCPAGEEVVREAAQRHSLHALFYNEYYQAIQLSRAHSLFCERVYGKDLGQHGMADMQQLEAMLSELEIRPNMRCLDFGCGDGQIAEHIAEATHSRVIGVDIADQAIRQAGLRTAGRRDRVQFYVADREGRLADLSGHCFERIWAIDSLFFVPDQHSVTRRLLALLGPRGRLGVFYICPPDMLESQTPFARALTMLGIPYRVQDFSAQNTEHWRMKKHALLELEGMFKAEGNEFLFKNRLAECEGLDHFHRYLYIVTTAY